MNHNKQIAVVMFSDVVGYTAMMGEDEARALSMLQKNHHIQKSLIEKYNGTFVKGIGDGLLAYFPTSGAALSCCYEIQKATNDAPGIKVRVGLNQAEIIIEDNDIFGDGVNIASRIEALAEPGGIYFSESVASSFSGMVGTTCVPMGKAKLKNVKTPVMIYALAADHLPVPSKRQFQSRINPRKKLAIIPAVIIFLVVLGTVIYTTVNYYTDQAKKEEAKNSISEIEQLVASSWRDYSDAYSKAKNLQKIIPDDTVLKRLIKESSVKVNINTEPQGAKVFVKKYNTPDAPWESIGTTPIDSVELPIAVFRWRIEKEGYETLLGVDTDFEFKDFSNMTKLGLVGPQTFFRKLDSTTAVPSGMVRVSGSAMPYGKLDDFFVDKHEVTNEQYKKFIDADGYEEEKFWEETFIHHGKKIGWSEAMKLFKDRTGQPGPSTWVNGKYPSGQENFPVSGVSWYEAQAYARFMKKDLPTGDHWGLARGENTFFIKWPQMGGFAFFAPFSNFNHSGPVAVGSLDGVTAYGAFDMAGNVREWCTNGTELGRLIRGGGWNSNTYEFNHLSQAPPFDRSETNGFRCVIYTNIEPMPDAVYRITDVLEDEPYPQNILEPVSNEVFDIYKAFFDYDQTNVNARRLTRSDNHAAWIHESVVFHAPYNDEEIIAHLFLPKNADPPYQTIIYGPGSAVFFQTNSDHLEKYYEYPVFVEHIVRSGRAVLLPVFQGTFERSSDTKAYLRLGGDTYQYAEFMSQVIKDYRRSIDYLHTRDDIDKNNIAFYGVSWGPFIGAILTSVDTRIKTNVFVSGGLRATGRPEVNMSNFIGRITIPTLMVNGKYDSVLPFNICIKPMFESLSTNTQDKKLVVFDTDHIPPYDEMVSETLSWFDKYLGKVDTKVVQ